MRAVKSVCLDNLLSFGPESEEFELASLNVPIGANGTSKSNLIGAFELLRTAPTDFARAIRSAGAPSSRALAGLVWPSSPDYNARPAGGGVVSSVGRAPGF